MLREDEARSEKAFEYMPCYEVPQDREFTAFPVVQNNPSAAVTPAVTSPEGADYRSPGQQPGSENPPFSWEALKGRNSEVGTRADGRLRLQADPYSALSGLENPNW